MVKVTFSLDEATVGRIRRTADRLGKAQSHVVREAVADYAARADRLSERERLRILEVLERVRRAQSDEVDRGGRRRDSVCSSRASAAAVVATEHRDHSRPTRLPW